MKTFVTALYVLALAIILNSQNSASLSITPEVAQTTGHFLPHESAVSNPIVQESPIAPNAASNTGFAGAFTSNERLSESRIEENDEVRRSQERWGGDRGGCGRWGCGGGNHGRGGGCGRYGCRRW